MEQTQADLVELIRISGIEEQRLISAFEVVPRAAFVPKHLVGLAYEDQPLPIPHGQVTTQPSLSALMIEALELKPTERVLEIGSGYGFQTALLASLCAHVTSIEIWDDIARVSRDNLEAQGIENVEVLVGDGSLGAPHQAPFDAVLVSAAFTRVPEPLADQLVEGGRIIQPIGPGGDEMVTLFHKRNGRLVEVRGVIPARFVRLIGDKAFPEGP
ncbi:MAG: protein-L-isoaspartate(D-aspartate) O-methyltransferase [Acidimicrobiia bacterium]